MTAVLVPATLAPVSSAVVVALMLIPMVMLLFRMEQRPSVRRLLVLAVFALVSAAVVVSADELVIISPCHACTLIDTSTWSGYLAWLASGCWAC